MDGIVKETLKRMLRNAYRENKKIFAWFFIYALFGGISPVFGVFLPKFVLEELSGAGRPERLLAILAAYFLAAAITGAIAAVAAQVTYGDIGKIRMDKVGELSKKLLEMDYKNVEDASFYEEYGTALKGCQSDAYGLEGIYHKLYGMGADVVAIGIFMVWIGKLDLFLLLALLSHVAISIFVGKKGQEYEYSMKESLARQQRKKDYYSRISHDFSYGKDIRIYHFRERVLENYTREIEGYQKLLQKIKTREWAWGLLELAFFSLSQAAMYGILIQKAFLGVSMGGISIADFTMYYAMMASLSQMLLLFGEKINFILKESRYVGDLFAFSDRNMTGSEGTRKRIQGDTLEITFRDVSFRYPKTDSYVFEHLNFTVKKGEKLAIVGVNGAGKSTLVKLMVGLYAPTEGEIQINGIPIQEFSRKELYQMFSVVFQDIHVLAYTIRENVACKEGASEDGRVWDALRRAGLGKKVESFEKGLDQMLLKVIDEGGTELSGGESQKLCIARALYENANMVIMDEPTAALDALAEAEIYESFNGLIGDKTAVFISHRLASTKFCHKIALFDKSGLKEYGSHQELMEKKGMYYTMFVTQGKYYNMEGERGAGDGALEELAKA